MRISAGRAAALAAAVMAATCAAAAAQTAAAPGIAVLSSSPARVTGGDALVEISAAGPVSAALNGVDVSSRFQRDPATGRMRALLTGLKVGPNVLAATAGGKTAQLTLTNHPLAGPVFSGPHQTPFVCETSAFKLPNGSTLGPAQDADCWAPTNVQYLYKPTGDEQLKPYDPAGPRPADLARTRPRGGAEVDYVVRLETGVINRAVYQIAVLAGPGAPSPASARAAGWNGALIYSFGGGCGAAFRQGRNTGGVANGGEMANDPLAAGYAVASATLNVLGQNCNDVTSAETAMMVKEHFIEEFGPPRHTIGLGGSGGSMQQNLLVQNYPGILDGILPERSYPDTATTLLNAADCPLIQHYMDGPGTGWSDKQKQAVVGYPSYETCTKAWSNYLPRWVSPLGSGCDSAAFITAQEGGGVAGTRDKAAFAGKLYDPKTAPDGTRCGYYDNAENIYGRHPDGSARSALDNVGVQYGLKAFDDGVIDFEQFAGLNEKIGGYDADGAIVARRSQGDLEAIRLSYRTGRVTTGVGMNRVPIIDVRSYVDANAGADVHSAYTTEISRRRWAAANGGAGNFIAFRTASNGSLRDDTSKADSPLRQTMRLALATMDDWLDAIDRDSSTRTRPEKVLRNKPAGLADACFTAWMRKIAMTPGGECARLFPDHSDPRLVAGQPADRLTLKCALSPVSQRFYKRPLTAAQLQRLAQTFPTGVCDSAKPPVGLEKLEGNWLSYPRASARVASR